MPQITNVKIPYETYERLIAHLSVHSATDGWAKQLLNELQQIRYRDSYNGFETGSAKKTGVENG